MHRDLAEELFETLLACDPGRFHGRLTEASTWELHGRSPLAGLHRGCDAIGAVLARLAELRPIARDAYDVMESEFHAVLTTRLVADGLDSDHAIVVVAADDGTLARAFQYVFDLYAFDDWFAG
jgi:hypothetical protein